MNKFLIVSSFAMSALLVIVEFVRRGVEYFSINATTMFEDLLGGVLLFIAATMLIKGSAKAKALMVGAWGYLFGGMFVPFFAHLEAFLRGVEFRIDHPIDDVASIVLKGAVWFVSGIYFVISLRNIDGEK